MCYVVLVCCVMFVVDVGLCCGLVCFGLFCCVSFKFLRLLACCCCVVFGVVVVWIGLAFVTCSVCHWFFVCVV